MKFSKYFMLAGAAAMLAACSSEEPVAPNGMPAEIAEADTYALVSLQLPSQSDTRAAEPTTSSIESEYKVANAQILIFEGADEDATFVNRFSLASNWENETSSQDISRKSYAQVAFPKGTFDTGKDYTACLVVNYPGEYPWPSKGQTFAAWSTTASSVSFTLSMNGATYLTMASAPEYKTDGIVTLVSLDPSAAKKDVTELDKNNVMGTFYIHRVAAKIEVSAEGEGNHVYSIANGAFAGDKVTVTGWAADVTAVKSKPILDTHDLDFSKSYTHGGDNGVAAFPSFARCFYGKGANYDITTELTSDDINYISSVSSFPAYVYVKENTMPFSRMDEKHGTRVVLKAAYQHGNAVTTLVKVGKNATTLLTKADLLAEIEAKAKVVCASEDVTVEANATSFNSGYYSLSTFCTIKKGTDEVAAADLNLIAEQIGLANATEKEIALYKDGVCYYTAAIKHFGDDDTPLGKTITKTSDYEAKHEGRWGVLRNNWYQVNVASFSKIGEPVIPEPTDDPLDKEKDEVQAMDFNIYMLNWAKRTQTENF